jgi:hypothetical protein
MLPAQTYRERAERLAENARDPKARQLAQTAALRWRHLAELAERLEREARGGADKDS